jgi:D-serine deaminase-like pyridoxal phosphate-dependent protein
MMGKTDWFLLKDVENIPSPSLIFYPERIKENIRLLISMIDDKNRLRPHVKTHKCKEVTELLIEAGIQKFKCATIAEAEMLGMCLASDILYAYQPVGPNIQRFFDLQSKFPDSKFSCLVDDLDVAKQIEQIANLNNIVADVYIDLNVGMNRTGIHPELALDLYRELTLLKGLKIKGLHAYDGHIHDASLTIRKQKAKVAIDLLHTLKKQMAELYGENINIVAGGTPTFPIYAMEKDFECSPGTFALWDKGYQDAYEEQAFLPAALVLSRIVSLPAKGLICTDLGHKAVAAEKELKNRVFFLNAPKLTAYSQSEEHLVLESSGNQIYQIGDVLYGIPYHICPTVALHEKAVCIQEDHIEFWDIVSRKRKITI